MIRHPARILTKTSSPIKNVREAIQILKASNHSSLQWVTLGYLQTPESVIEAMETVTALPPEDTKNLILFGAAMLTVMDAEARLKAQARDEPKREPYIAHYNKIKEYISKNWEEWDEKHRAGWDKRTERAEKDIGDQRR